MEITKEILEAAINQTDTIAACLDKIGIVKSSGTYKSFKRRVRKWNIDISHFLTQKESAVRNLNKIRHIKHVNLKSLLVEHSKASRGTVKRRLLQEGLKQNKCELCGQEEMWHGKKMALILDHINGIRNDNRLENLRIICPNCNAILDTFAGRNNKQMTVPSLCPECKSLLVKKRNKYCSILCANIARAKYGRKILCNI